MKVLLDDGTWERLRTPARFAGSGYVRRARWCGLPLPWFEWMAMRSNRIIARGVGFGEDYARSQAWNWASCAA